MKNILKHRLRSARAASGLSLRELSARIDGRVTAQAINQYELGHSVPKWPVITALADALHIPPEYLFYDANAKLEGIEFRRKRPTTRKEENKVQEAVQRLLNRYLQVERLLDLPSVTWDKPREAPYPVLSDLAEAEHAARRLREYWGLGFDPIVDLVALLEDRGIKVLSMNLTGIDGLTANVRQKAYSGSPVIVVNRNDCGERQRFTIAHELGHLMLNIVNSIDEEKVAHRFAGAFLMPAEKLRSELGVHRKSIGWEELFDLKLLFEVSVQALTYRCKDLRIFDSPLYHRLFRQFKILGWCDFPYEEPYSKKEGEQPRRFKRLCFRALAEGLLTEEEASSLLNISEEKVRSRMEKPPKKFAKSGNPNKNNPQRIK